ncbi:MAG: DNA-protecting protein DprA [Lachnospiraceae bacterium]|nr:DNA-protecting protein DprA [Lachnospiraceae bacterium]
MEELYNRRNTTSKRRDGIQYIQQNHAAYPQKLLCYKGMPKGLYVLGKLPDKTRKSVAIVGARRSSAYGNQIAKSFAKELAGAGVQIISGMAWGIDGKAHEGALEGGGDTYAVLGCGVDICYPSGHRKIYEAMIQRGGILSEQPPGMPPIAGHFPARNRIISGLSDLVLVVEAKERSGSLITADLALEQGKDVFAVPGRIGDEMSKGCLNLIKQGAGLADSPLVLLEALGIKRNVSEKSVKIVLEKNEDIVYSWIRLQPVSLEELVKKTGFGSREVLFALVGLELKGCIREMQKNQYVRTDLRITNGEISGYRGVTSKGENN